jgi:hypothetical protein
MVLYSVETPFSAPDEGWSPRGLDMMGTDSTGTDTTSDSTGGTDDTGTDGTDTGTDDGGEEGPDPRRRVTVVRGQDGAWTDLDTMFTEWSVAGAGIAPDGKNAMLLHALDGADPESGHGYTLVDLGKAVPIKKLQKVPAAPLGVLWTPEGDRAAVLLREDDLVRRVDMVNLRTFIVDELLLGSPPTGGGYVPPTAKIFVAQEHPSGRITFIDTDNDAQTVTGYELNDDVKD